MYYNFGRTSFSNFVWINGGATFFEPGTLNIEMTTPGEFGVEVFTPDGDLAGRADRPNRHGGWSSFYFSSGYEFSPGPGLRSGHYKIKIVNRSPRKKFLKQGDLEYSI